MIDHMFIGGCGLPPFTGFARDFDLFELLLADDQVSRSVASQLGRTGYVKFQ